MLMDTGLGKDGYSMIGQGRIAEIIAAKSRNGGKSLKRRRVLRNTVTAGKKLNGN